MLKALKDWLESLRSIAVSILVIAVSALVGIVLVAETFSRQLLIEPSSVSSDLAKKGYTAQRVGEDLVTRVKQLQRESAASAQAPVGLEQGLDTRTEYSGGRLRIPTPALSSVLLRSDSSLPQVSLPGSGLDARAVLRALRSAIGIPDNKVTVTVASLEKDEKNIVVTEEGTETEKIELRMALHFGGHDEYQVVKGTSVSDAIDQAAMRLMYFSAPETFLLLNFARDRRIHNFEATESSAYQMLATPDLKQKDWVRGLLALILHERDRSDEAIALMREILAGGPVNADHHVFNLVQMLAAKGRFEEARKELGKARAGSAKSELLVVADVLLKLQEGEGANEGAASMDELERKVNKTDELELVQKGLADHPKSPLLQNVRGLTLMQAKNFAEAEKAFRQALELNPKYASAVNNLGMIFLTQRDSSRALQMFRLATELDQGSSIALSNLGAAYGSLGLPAEALRSFERAARINSKSQICFGCWANELVDLHAYAQAIEKIHLGLAVRPDSPHLYYVWARALTGLKRYSEAIAKLRSVERMIGNRPPLLFAALVDVLIRAGRIADGEKECREISAGNAAPETANTCGRVLMRRGRPEAAARHFRAATDAWMAEKTEASRRLAAGAMNNWADALLHQKKFDDAEQKILEARGLDSTGAYISVTYAEILLARGRYDDAVVEFETISRRWPTYQTANFFSVWARALRKANRPKEAAELEKRKTQIQ